MSVLTPSRSPTKFRRAGSVAAWRKDPEVRLMLRVRDGDVAAFAELEARYRDRVLGWFCRRLGDRGEAEDLTQDVFLRLYRARAVLPAPRPLRHLGLPHHPERGPERPAVAPPPALGAVGRRGAGTGFARSDVAGARRFAVAADGAR